MTKGASLLKFARVSPTGDGYYSFPGSFAVGRGRRILEPGPFLVTEVSSRWSCWGLKTKWSSEIPDPAGFSESGSASGSWCGDKPARGPLLSLHTREDIL